jgi:hypothetical protein
MLQSEKSASSAPLWSIDRKMTRQTSPTGQTSFPVLSSCLVSSSLWNSTPIGKSLLLRLCQHEQSSPQLILEDKVFRSAIRLQHGSTYRSQMQFVGTLIVDDETQRLTYVIDRLQLSDSFNNDNHSHHALSPNKQLNGEFLIPIRCEKKTTSTSVNNNNNNTCLIKDAIKVMFMSTSEQDARVSFAHLDYRCVLSFIVADRITSILISLRTNGVTFVAVDQR